MPDKRIKCFELLILSLTISDIKFAGINAKAIPVKNVIAKLLPTDTESFKS